MPESAPAPAPAPAPPPVPAATEAERPAAPEGADPKPGLPIEAQLVRMGLMTLDQLADANRERLETGKSVADIAVERGWVTPQDLAILTGEVAPAPAQAAPAPEPAPALAPAPAPEAAPAPVEEVAPAAPAAPAAVPAPAAPPAAAPAPAPAAAPAQAAAPAPAPVAAVPAVAEPPEPTADAKVFRVALHLNGGERVEVAALPDEEAAKARAREIVFDLTRPRADEWPYYAGRFVRPEAIVSVDVVSD